MADSQDHLIPKDEADGVKRWLDYLSKLKDRSDRTDQITGQTKWVYYGIIGTLLYKATSVLPQMAADKIGLHAILISTILSFNFSFFLYEVFRPLVPRIKTEIPDIFLDTCSMRGPCAFFNK